MMPAAIRPISEVSISTTGTTTMAAPQLPLTFDRAGDLRIVLVPNADDGTPSASERSESQQSMREEASDRPHRRSQVPPGQHIPTHPIPSMQSAFAESLHEVTNSDTMPDKPKLRELDAQGRRERLLEQPAEAEPFDMLWRYRPGQEQHEMYKLISQISFGVYLLLNGLAADNTQVVTILQGHINEVDEFLEVMLEDFAKAHEDLSERISHLQLPMSNRQAFEAMLEDRNFRAQILAGNEKIDHILARTNAAMKQWDDDIDAGLRSSESFMEWLNEHNDKTWPEAAPDLNKIYNAMKGNSDGWLNAFDDLNNQAQDLNGLVIKLMTIVAEMEKTAGEVSRKTWTNITPFTLPVRSAISDEAEAEAETPIVQVLDHALTPRASTHFSIRSGESANTLQPLSFHDAEVSTLSDFPLPGGTPLLPPPRVSRASPTNLSRSSSSSASTPKAAYAPKSPALSEVREEQTRESVSQNGFDDGPLYILQPKVYSPKVPQSPVASPTVRNSSAPSKPRVLSSLHEQVAAQQQMLQQQQQQLQQQQYQPPQKKLSIRHRISQRTKPPSSIQIPPPINTENRRPMSRQSPPRTSRSQANDSAYGSDAEGGPVHRLPRVASHVDFAVPSLPLMTSPQSEHQQYYRPVRASPHSPLQQRPHTSGLEGPGYRASGYFPGHQRNQPSRMGGMSTLSSVTTATYDDGATVRSNATSATGGKRVKKKKSAFGWLKKAFTLDESERAEYEARRAVQFQQQQQYMDSGSPKFLDGKRLR